MSGGKNGFGLNFQSTPPSRRHLLMRAIQLLLILPFLVVLLLAVHFQFDGIGRMAIQLLILGAAVALARLWWANNVWTVWLAAAALVFLASVWWGTIQPTNDSDWQPDVEFGVTSEITGNIATLHHVRDFDWRTTTDFTPRWEERRYNIDEITSVDLFTSVWGNPAIAHVLVGFGFKDGQHVVFSAETRKAKGQVYTTIGGFFRLYTLVLLAAEERDIIRLRTDVRDAPPETVRIFALNLGPERRKELFLDYLALGNRLAEQPEFYNTLTTNCTTVVWRLARKIEPGLPLNWRVLLSGYFPQYLYDHGAIRTDVPFDQVMQEAIIPGERVAGPDGPTFSRRLRALEGD